MSKRIQTAPPVFLRRKQVVAMLNVTERRAMEILALHGVKPVDFGPGRGNGLRWLASAVMQVADALHAEAQAAKCVPLHRPKTRHVVLGRSAAELYAEFQKGRSAS